MILLLLATLSETACRRKGTPETPTPAKPKTAKEAFILFSRAVKSKDCPAVLALVGGGLQRRISKKGCRHFVSDLNEHGFELIEVLDEKVDGRNSQIVNIRARITLKSKQKVALVPLERTGNGWRVTDL